jgi:RNA recognition motif-containing protein
MRPVFCGNFDFDARQSDLERLFSKYGPIRRIDMKSGTHRNSLPPSSSSLSSPFRILETNEMPHGQCRFSTSPVW